MMMEIQMVLLHSCHILCLSTKSFLILFVRCLNVII